MTDIQPARSSEATQKIREQILAQPDLTQVPVDVSEFWSGLDDQLYVRKMSAAERSSYELSMDFNDEGTPQDRLNIQTKLAVRALVDKDGDRIFGDDDLDLLAAKNSEALQMIFEAAAEVNGLTKDSIRALEKNSSETTSDS